MADSHRESTNINSADNLARILSIFAFLMSAFTFCLQFVAHDSLLYNISHISITVWPKTNAYFTAFLSVYNTGNRSEALVSATAIRIQRNLGDQLQITDADCTSPENNKFQLYSLFPVSQDHESSQLASIEQYNAVIDAGKIFTKNLTFSLFFPDNNKLSADDYKAEGVVCLKLLFTDSTGKLYRITQALGGIQFEKGKTVYRQEGTPAVVVNQRHIELPF